MDWRDEGILIAARRHGESSAIIEVFTAGARAARRRGARRGGAADDAGAAAGGAAAAGMVGAARGAYRHFPGRSDRGADGGDHGRPGGAGGARGDDGAARGDAAGAGRASGALCAEPATLVEALGAAPDWPARYAAWELALLAELGFGLDLERCAVTGATEDLAWVSPKSGRAVSRAAGAAWAERLLPLPAFLREGLGGAAGDGRGAGGAGADRLLPRRAGGAGAAAPGAAAGAGAGGGGDPPALLALPGAVVPAKEAGRAREAGRAGTGGICRRLRRGGGGRRGAGAGGGRLRQGRGRLRAAADRAEPRRLVPALPGGGGAADRADAGVEPLPGAAAGHRAGARRPCGGSGG